MRFSLVSAAALLAAAGAVNAGTLLTTTTQTIFSSTYSVSVYRVATDLSSQGLSPAAGRVEPEGMTFFNGNLYVASDGTAAESNGYLAVYPGGNLSTASAPVRYTITNTAGSNAGFGPEGITVNTRGSGYGSFSGSAPRFVGVDNVTAPVSARWLGAMNSATGVVEDGYNDATNANANNYDDIVFVPGASAASDRFVVIDSAGTQPTLRTFGTSFTAASGPTVDASPTRTLPFGAKGLTFIPAADAALLSSAATTDCLLVAISPDAPNGQANNFLVLYNAQTLAPVASMGASPFTAGLFGNIESLAYDPATRQLFIGDENSTSSQIAVFTVPAPGAASLLAGAGLLAARRRRR
ncbi:MAG: hypothetical protein K2Q20_08600 [Phycisphaerales bacterium]|nr:hypothetical protein [Phycisphaerales bacterium]